jgi:flagellar basal body-associated protein FliL
MREINPTQEIRPRRKSLPKSLVLTLIVVVLAALVLGAAMVYVTIFSKSKTTAIKLDESKYYAVFLSNGQVYFGHLKNYHTANPELTDIYYLQLAQSPQPTEGEKKEGEQAQTPEQQPQVEAQPIEQQNQQTGEQKGLTLIKLGQELHGPEDSMILNKEHILFVEQLKADGQVVKAIENYKEEKK